MSSRRSNDHVTNRFGITLPRHYADMIDYAEMHPEMGRELDLVNAHRSRINDQAPVQSDNRHAAQNAQDQTDAKNQFTFVSYSPDECPTIQGSIVYFNGGKSIAIDCRGHVVAILPDDENLAVVMIELPRDTNNNDMIPCLCPVTLLDEQTIDAVNTANKGEYDGRKMQYKYFPVNPPMTSAVAQRGAVQGHLLMSGPKIISGRVVDARMLASIEAGCFRIGDHLPKQNKQIKNTKHNKKSNPSKKKSNSPIKKKSNHHPNKKSKSNTNNQSNKNYYTLNRVYAVDSEKLIETVHVIKDSPHGIQLHPGSRIDGAKLIHWGADAVGFHLVRHRTLHEAVEALHNASNLPPPTIKECMLQLSIGGNPDLLTVGRFLPCNGGNFNARAVCACGFEIEGLPHSKVKDHTRCRCGCGTCNNALGE